MRRIPAWTVLPLIAMSALAQERVLYNPLAPPFTVSLKPIISGDHTSTPCTPGVTANLYDSGFQYYCSATNTWTLLALSAGGNIAVTSNVLKGDGAGNAIAATQTGSGNAVLQTSPTLVTPVLGVAAATSINKLTLTPPATGSTLTIADGKTFTLSNTLTLTATDGSTLAIGAGGTLGSNAYTSTAYAPLANPTFTGTVTIPTPYTIGAVSMTATGTQLNFLNAAAGTTGTTSTNLVFSASPTFTGTITGAAETLSGAFTNNGSYAGSAIVPAANGGSGVANTATHTLGSSNQNWATIGTGIVKVTTTTGAITDAASADVYGLWSGTCNNTTFLRGDGACAAPAGAGTVTVVGAGSLTSTDCVTGGGSQTIQTPSASCTVDSSGNLLATSVGSVGDGVHPSTISLIGNTTVTTVSANTFYLIGPSSATFTGLGLQFSSTAPSANNVLLVGAPTSGVAQATYGKVDLSSMVTSSLPLGSISGFGTGVATFLATPSGVNLTSALTTPLTVGGGGTGQASYTDGQLLIGNTATGGLSKAALTAGANVTITNGNGTITIASSGGGGSGCVTSGANTDLLTDDGAGGCSSNTNALLSSGGVFTKIANIATSGNTLGGVPIIYYDSAAQTGKSASTGTITVTSPPAGWYHLAGTYSPNANCTTGTGAVHFAATATTNSNAQTYAFPYLAIPASGGANSVPIDQDLEITSGNLTYSLTLDTGCTTGTGTFDYHIYLYRIL